MHYKDYRSKHYKYITVFGGYLLAILTFMTSGLSICSVPTPEAEHLIIVFNLTLIIVLLCFIVINIYSMDRFTHRYAYIFAFGCLFVLISFFNSPKEYKGLFLRFLFFLTFFLFCRIRDHLKVFLRCFFRVFMVIAVLTLIFFIVLYVLKVPLPYTTINNGQYRVFFGIFTDSYMYYETIGSFAFRRLHGIFWEPGVFSVYLTIAVYYYCLMIKRKIGFQLAVLLICLVLTKSTTGLMLGVILIALMLLKRIRRNEDRWMVAVPMIIIAGGLAAILFLGKKNSTSLSYGIRMHDFTRALEIWMQHFWLGTGYNNMDLYLKDGSYGNSNGFISWCMMMGVLGLIVIMLPFILNCISCAKRHRFNQILETCLFVVLNFTEPLIDTPLMIFWIVIEYYKFAQKIVKRKHSAFELLENQ